MELNLVVKSLLSLALLLNIPLSHSVPDNRPRCDGTSSKVDRVVLNNGFTYYVQEDKSESDKVVIKLIVKAGDMDVNVEKTQLPHLLEHLAFRGTRNFPGDSIHKFLAHWGLSMGVNLNASTSLYTTYDFNVPSKDKDLVYTCLRFFRDVAQDGLSFNSEDIAVERKIVEEELLVRSSSLLESINGMYAKMLSGTCYESSLSINHQMAITSLYNVDSISLQTFYKQYYKPQNEGLIIVGDIDSDVIKKEIKSLFNDLDDKRLDKKQNRLACKLNIQQKKQLYTAIDKDQKGFEVNFYIKYQESDDNSVRKEVTRELYNQIMDNRLQYINDNSRMFLRNNVNYPVIRGLNNVGVAALVLSLWATDKSDLEMGTKSLFVEFERVKQVGFTMEELDAAKKKIRQSYLAQASLNVEAKANLINSSFIGDSFNFTDTGDRNSILKIVEDVDLNDLKNAFSSWDDETNLDITILSSTALKGDIPNKRKILQWIDQAKRRKIDSLKRSGDQLFALTKMKNIGEDKIKKIDYLDSLQLVEIDLKNGAKVILKQGSTNSISFQAVSNGGIVLYKNDEKASVALAAELVKDSGLSGIEKYQLDAYLNRHSVDISPYIDDREEGIKGSCPKNEIEVLLQMMTRYFEKPVSRMSNKDFKQWIESKKQYAIGNVDLLPDTLKYLMNFRRYTRSVLKSRDLDEVKKDKCYEVFFERFSNAGDFTFIFSGLDSVQKYIPVITSYVGSLPDFGKRESTAEWQLPMPVKTYTVRTKSEDLKEDQAVVNFMYLSMCKQTIQNKASLGVISKLLEIILNRRIRVANGETYGVASYVHTSKYDEKSPILVCKISVSVYCKRDNINSVANSIDDEISNLIENGPTQDDLDYSIYLYKRQLQSMSDLSWVQYLAAQYSNHDDPIDILKGMNGLDSLSKKTMKELLENCLKKEHLIQSIQETKI